MTIVEAREKIQSAGFQAGLSDESARNMANWILSGNTDVDIKDWTNANLKQEMVSYFEMGVDL